MYSSTVITGSIVGMTTKNYFPSISLYFLVVLLQFYQQIFKSVIFVLFSMCFLHSWLCLKKSLISNLSINLAGILSIFGVIVLFGTQCDVFDLGSWLLATAVWFSILSTWLQPLPSHKDISRRELLKTSRKYSLRLCVTLIGTWCGAIPYVLDWDRQWQIWPNTCLLGLIAGNLLSHVLGLFMR